MHRCTLLPPTTHQGNILADITPPTESRNEPKHIATAGEHVIGETEKNNFSPALAESLSSSSSLTALNKVESASDSKALATAGLLGDVQLTGLGDGLLGSWNSDQKMISDYDAIAKKVGAPEMTTAEKVALMTLPSDQKDMYRMMLTSLEKLANKEINPAQYMGEGLRNAADLAQKNEGSWWNPFGSSKEALFVSYVGVSFSDKSLGIARDAVRAGAGSAFDLAGATLERTYSKIIGDNKNGAQGFNPNIVDSNNPENSVTHHFRELLMVGYNRGRNIGNWATTTVDKPEDNPGDVRNGYFGTMIGSALKNGKITPSEAAEMTIWAYTAHGGKQPPWGELEAKGGSLATDDYYLNPWLKAFRDRNR